VTDCFSTSHAAQSVRKTRWFQGKRQALHGMSARVPTLVVPKCDDGRGSPAHGTPYPRPFPPNRGKGSRTVCVHPPLPRFGGKGWG
jgi:hypothetical protein